MPLSDDQTRRLLGLAATGEDDRYEELELLGEGGMGTVTAMCWDSRLLREVAVKRLKAEAGDVKRFVREARITAQLEHPNVVAVYDMEDSEVPSFTMRRVRGVSVAERLENGNLGDLNARLDVFRKVCDALAYAHEHGVVHRDLKPSNVMVGLFGEVLVVDWGLAQAIGDPESTTDTEVVGAGSGSVLSLGGTPEFMAPEQQQGGSVDERTDVYGLGRLLACLVGARRVGRDERVGPSELREVVQRSTALAPEDRYQSVLALQEDVAAYQQQRPLPGHPTSVWRRLVLGVRRNQAVAAASAVTGLVLGVLLAVAVSVQAQAHVRAIGIARNDALAAAAEAEQQLATAQLALAWAAESRDDLDAVRQHLERAESLRPPQAVDLALARAWMASRHGRPLFAVQAAAVRTARYGPDGRIGVVAGGRTSVLVDGQLVPLMQGGIRDWSTAGILQWDSGECRMVSATGGEVLWQVPCVEQPRYRVDRDGNVVAVSKAGHGIVLRDGWSGDELRRLDHLDQVYGIGPGGNPLLGRSIQGSVHRVPEALYLIDEQGEVLKELPGIAVAMLSPDGSLLAWVDGSAVRLASGETERAVEAIGTATLRMTETEAVVWAPPQLVTFGLSGPVRRATLPLDLVDVSPSGDRVLMIGADRVEEWALAPVVHPEVATEAVTDVQVSPDGELVAVVGWSGRLVVLDSVNRQVLFERLVDPHGLRGVAWAADGRRVAVAGRDGVAVELDLVTGTELWRTRREGSLAMDVAYADDALVVGWEDGKLTTRDGAGERVDEGPLGSLWAFLLDPLVVSGRDDLDPTVVVADSELQGPVTAGYGIARSGSRVAVGHGGGATVLDLSSGAIDELAGHVTVSTSFLTEEVLLTGNYAGELSVWRHQGGQWTSLPALPITDGVVSAIAVHGPVVWVGTSQGELFDLHLGDGPTMTFREAAARGVSSWLRGRVVQGGLDGVRGHVLLGDRGAAAEVARSLSSPAAALWLSWLEAQPQ